MQFRCNNPVLHSGTFYQPGEIIPLTKKEALLLGGAVEGLEPSGADKLTEAQARFAQAEAGFEATKTALDAIADGEDKTSAQAAHEAAKTVLSQAKGAVTKAQNAQKSS